MKPYFDDGQITLYHADCFEVTDWLAADVLITDPPYGIAWTGVGTYGRSDSRGKLVPTNSDPIAGDGTLEARDLALEAWGCKPAAIFGVWHKERPAGTKHRLVWWKRGQAPGPLTSAFMSQDEEIYILGDGWPKSSPPQRSVIATDEHRSVQPGLIGHPTPKPLGLMELLVSRAPAGVVADPFAGSGSTLIAAQRLGRRAIGVEIDEKYCEIAARRLSQQALDFGALDGA